MYAGNGNGIKAYIITYFSVKIKGSETKGNKNCNAQPLLGTQPLCKFGGICACACVCVCMLLLHVCVVIDFQNVWSGLRCMTLYASTAVKAVFCFHCYIMKLKGLLVRWMQLHHPRRQSPAVKLQDVTILWTFVALEVLGFCFWNCTGRPQISYAVFFPKGSFTCHGEICHYIVRFMSVTVETPKLAVL